MLTSLLAALAAAATVAHAVPYPLASHGAGFAPNGTYTAPTTNVNSGRIIDPSPGPDAGPGPGTVVEPSPPAAAPPAGSGSGSGAGSFPAYDAPRCANTTAHQYTVEQAWVRAEDFQITPDCLSYGVGSYAALQACARRNVCFGNCARTYKDCVTEWLADPETHAVHNASSNNERTWEKLPLEQYVHFNDMSCKCMEVPKLCQHVNC